MFSWRSVLQSRIESIFNGDRVSTFPGGRESSLMEFWLRAPNESPPKRGAAKQPDSAENGQVGTWERWEMGAWAAGALERTMTTWLRFLWEGLEERRSRGASEKLLSILIFIRSQCRLCFSHIHGSHIHKNAQCALATVNWQAKVVI